MVELKLSDGKLIVEFNPAETRPSKSGKTLVVATTGGFKWFGDTGVSVNIIKRK